MLKTSSGRWTTMIRIPHWTIVLELTSSALLKLRNLSLDIRRGSWRFWSWLRGLEELKMSSRRLKTSIRTSNEEQQLGNKLWECVFFLSGGSAGEEKVFFSPCFSISFEVFSRDSNVSTSTAGQWEWRFKWLSCSSRGSVSSLNCHLCVRYQNFVTLSWNDYIFFLSQKRLPGTTHPYCNIAFMQNAVSTWILSTVVAGLRTTNDLGGRGGDILFR